MTGWSAPQAISQCGSFLYNYVLSLDYCSRPQWCHSCWQAGICSKFAASFVTMHEMVWQLWLPAKPPQSAKAQHQAKEAETFVMQLHILNNHSILPSFWTLVQCFHDPILPPSTLEPALNFIDHSSWSPWIWIKLVRRKDPWTWWCNMHHVTERPELYGKVNSNYFFTCSDTQSLLYYRRWCICSECSITRANKRIL